MRQKEPRKRRQERERRRGRPRLTAAQKRSRTVAFKLRDSEHQRLLRLAQKAGFPTLSEYCRDAALQPHRRAHPARRSLLRELRRIRTLLDLARQEGLETTPLDEVLERLQRQQANR